jgi:thymidine kinase
MGSFGTGLVPGSHGMLGFEVLVPGEDRLLNELSWEDGPVPELWQPRATWFERASAAGIEVMRTGPGFFEGSGLTRAALRGGRFVAAKGLDARVDATLSHARSPLPSLTYLYWGDLDKVGHVHGCESWQWGDELETIDRALARLADGLPGDCSLTITADHGMVDVPMADRIDVAFDAELASGLRHTGGEPRAPQLYCEPGAVADVLATWQARVGDFAWVLSRQEAVAQGLFGAVHDEHLARIGDVVVEHLTHGQRADYLICDEAQFYTAAQIEQLARIVDELGIEVNCFGITADFRTELFPGSKRLFELADRVQVLQVAALCWCGARATHNARIVDGVMVVEGEQVVVGDTAASDSAQVEYEVLCRRHYMRRMSSHAARLASSTPDVLPFDLDVCPVPPRD